MRSFAISAFAALAFGVLSSAAPLLEDGLVNVDHGSALNVASVNMGSTGTPGLTGSPGTQGPPATPGKQRRSQDKCLNSILNGVIDTIEPIVEEILALTEIEATLLCLTPLIAKVEAVLSGAIVEVKGLAGLSITAILTIEDGVLLDLHSLAELICKLIKVVVKLVECILAIVTSVVKVDVLPLLLKIVDLLVELLSCILGLVGQFLSGLLAVVVGLLADVLPIIKKLGLTALLKCLGL